MAARIAFLDRDGTINIDHGYVHRWSDWQFAPGAIEGMRLLQDAGYLLAVVTNQSGIARGYYSEEHVLTLHQQLADSLASSGIRLSAIAFCPHTSEANCECRKPGIGLAAQIARQLHDEVDLANSWMVGDRISDYQFGRSLRVRTVLLRSDYWSDADLEGTPDYVADNLLEAAQFICATKQ